MKKFAIPLSLLLLILVLQGAKYGLQYAAPNILPPAGPITRAVVIYESELGDALAYPQQHEAMVGRTSQALRKKDKWRQYDKDHVPADYADLLTKAEAGQTQKKWEKWLGLYHATSLGWSGAMPGSDTKLKERIEQNGGY